MLFLPQRFTEDSCDIIQVRDLALACHSLLSHSPNTMFTFIQTIFVFVYSHTHALTPLWAWAPTEILLATNLNLDLEISTTEAKLPCTHTHSPTLYQRPLLPAAETHPHPQVLLSQECDVNGIAAERTFFSLKHNNLELHPDSYMYQ